MDAEEEASESKVAELESSAKEYDFGMEGIYYASTPTSRSFFDNYESDDEALAFCFMEKSSKGNNCPSRKNSLQIQNGNSSKGSNVDSSLYEYEH